MRNYALNMNLVKISRERRKTPEAALTEDEITVLRAGAGELGWLSWQLRSDLASTTGFVQRAMEAPCVGDLVMLNKGISDAKRWADFALRFPRAWASKRQWS